ncbi:MAG: aminotransferase class V-fold PLP-dependent enzyme, partial [Clostridiales bacterium]|nr:aminotransferase class V-fold PLP-dependent enzyme [Clostridiales bacterium]
MTRTVYADNAATTSLSKHALEEMMPYLTEEYGNPSTVYSLGRNAKKALENARTKIASALVCRPDEIFFTGGGTEADNWAIKSAAIMKKEKGKHIISTALEHHAVLHTLQSLEKAGYEVTYLGVDGTGNISLDELKNAIRKDTILISVITASNEMGTIMPIAEIGTLARERGILFHTDAVQAVGHIPINTEDMKIDMLSLSAHKFKGPKGIGALYIKKGLRLPPNMHGGAQERGRRSGTENVAGIVGMAAALEIAVLNMDKNINKITAMRDRLIEGLLTIPRTRLTGDPTNRLPGAASFVFECIEGESMVLL